MQIFCIKKKPVLTGFRGRIPKRRKQPDLEERELILHNNQSKSTRHRTRNGTNTVVGWAAPNLVRILSLKQLLVLLD
jgi:hypothetical protein